MIGITAFFIVSEADLPAKLKRLAREAVSDPDDDGFTMLVVPKEHALLARLLFPGEVTSTRLGFIADADDVREVLHRLADENGVTATFLPVLCVWTLDKEEMARIVNILGAPLAEKVKDGAYTKLH